MGLFDFFNAFKGSGDNNESSIDSCSSINPANGLPMIENSCIDIEGNPFGTDSISSFDMDNSFDTSSSFDDFSSFDDSF